MNLNEMELERYKKQVMLPEIGSAGQLKLKAASILVVGAGGLGSAVLPYLTGAGVGEICIIDNDTVSLSNLQRQVLYTTAELGLPKSDLAREKLQALNPEISLTSKVDRLSLSNAENLVSGRSVVVDCTDNLETRFLINEICVQKGIPFVYGAVYCYEGQVAVFHARFGPCFRCLYPVLPPADAVPNPEDNGLLGPVPGVIGLLQSIEVLKLILGIGETLIGKLLLYDGATASFKTIKLERNPACPVCGTKS